MNEALFTTHGGLERRSEMNKARTFLLCAILLSGCEFSVPSLSQPTQTPYPTYTPYPTNTSQPINTPAPIIKKTPTRPPPPTPTPLPTNTATPTRAPLPFVWSTTLEDMYVKLSELGYWIEMNRFEEDWLVSFADEASYYESNYWSWYGTQGSLAAAKITDEVEKLTFWSCFLDFPTSGIGQRAETYYLGFLQNVGFDETTAKNIVDYYSATISEARDKGANREINRTMYGYDTVALLEIDDWGDYVYTMELTPSP
jgi:hypothetical protein